MATTEINILSANCVECGKHFQRTAEAVAEALHWAGSEHSREKQDRIALRHCFRKNGWLWGRALPEDADHMVDVPTCPVCFERITAERLANAEHPAWGCTDCIYDLEQGFTNHARF